MITVASPVVPEVALESKVAFLRQPTSFKEPTYRVEAIETHMSWVFLTDDHAYKLKKPVCYPFSTSAQRMRGTTIAKKRCDSIGA